MDRRGVRLNGICRVMTSRWEDICRRGCNPGGQDSEGQLTLASILPGGYVYPQLMRTIAGVCFRMRVQRDGVREIWNWQDALDRGIDDVRLDTGC